MLRRHLSPSIALAVTLGAASAGERVEYEDLRIIDPQGCVHGAPAQRDAARAALARAADARVNAADRVLLSHAHQRRTGLDIILDASPEVAADAAFVATLERAVARWEQLIASPVRVLYSVDFTSGEPFIAAASSSIIGNGAFSTVRAQLISRAGPGTLAYLEALPQSTPPHIANAGLNAIFIYADPRAVRKVLGASDPNDISSEDASIVFNTDFAFDLDNSDGVTPGTIDLETVMVHEIGHALGFVSGVDSQFVRTTLDIFRFGIDGAFNDPATLDDIGSSAFPRELRVGFEAAIDPVGAIPPYTEPLRFSSGVNGDGRQASHWKADELLGLAVPIGIMDPTAPLDALIPEYFTDADRLAFRLLGWEIALPSAPGCPADLTTEGSSNGVPDGIVSISDFSYYLTLWADGSPTADITLDGTCDPSTGGGDGVSISDYACYLTIWAAGCP